MAFKKTYPALFDLYKNNLLPKNTKIIGYARSKFDVNEFKGRISSKFKTTNQKELDSIKPFLDLCTYESGDYDDRNAFRLLGNDITESEVGNGESLR